MTEFPPGNRQRGDMTATTNHSDSGQGPPLRPGERLRQARLHRGITLAKISESTRIAPRHLAAIEAADYDKLPAAPYTRGYLRAYAGFLDFRADEAEELAAAFFRERGAGRTTRAHGLADPELAEPVRDSPAAGALCMLAVIVLSLGLFCASTGWNPLARVLGGADVPANEDMAFHPAPPETLVEINARALNLEAHFLKDTEVRLQVDGAGVHRAVYVKESKANWEANSTIRIEFAKPHSAELRVNGRPLGFPTPNNGQYLLSLRAKPGAS